MGCAGGVRLRRITQAPGANPEVDVGSKSACLASVPLRLGPLRGDKQQGPLAPRRRHVRACTTRSTPSCTAASRRRVRMCLRSLSVKLEGVSGRLAGMACASQVWGGEGCA